MANATGGLAIYLVSTTGGEAQEIVDHGCCPSWSPDGSRVLFTYHGNLHIVDIHTLKSTQVPAQTHMVGGWWAADTLVAFDRDEGKFKIFNFRTEKWSDLIAGNFVYWALSIDGKYLYFTKRESDSVLRRVSVMDRRVETVTSLKGVRHATNPASGGLITLGVAPDGSPILSRDISSQEIYALKVRWP
jgi:Tol biopolymer transport system component